MVISSSHPNITSIYMYIADYVPSMLFLGSAASTRILGKYRILNTHKYDTNSADCLSSLN